MTTRRSFIQFASCTVPVALGAMRAPAGALGQGTALQLVMVDESPASQMFGRRMQTQGARILSIREGDITAAWLQSVKPAWQRGPVAIAGLTAPAALFCMEQLAFMHGLRVVFHAEHMLHTGGDVSHEVQRAGQLGNPAAALVRAGARWPQRLADSLGAHRMVRGTARPGPSLAALQPALPEGATLLSSWIIAAA
jgi:hypothetical protein